MKYENESEVIGRAPVNEAQFCTAEVGGREGMNG